MWWLSTCCDVLSLSRNLLATPKLNVWHIIIYWFYIQYMSGTTWGRTNDETIFNYNPLDNSPAPHNPDGRRPVCIQSRFILCSSLRAVIETSWVLSPNSNMCANRGIYRHGSIDRNKQFESQLFNQRLRYTQTSKICTKLIRHSEVYEKTRLMQRKPVYFFQMMTFQKIKKASFLKVLLLS